MIVVANTSPLRYLVADRSSESGRRSFRYGSKFRAPLNGNSSIPVLQTVCSNGLRNTPLGSRFGTLMAGQTRRWPSSSTQARPKLYSSRLNAGPNCVMDERLGRRVALSRGMAVIGALGILRESFRRGLIEDPRRLAAQLR